MLRRTSDAGVGNWVIVVAAHDFSGILLDSSGPVGLAVGRAGEGRLGCGRSLVVGGEKMLPDDGSLLRFGELLDRDGVGRELLRGGVPRERRPCEGLLGSRRADEAWNLGNARRGAVVRRAEAGGRFGTRRARASDRNGCWRHRSLNAVETKEIRPFAFSATLLVFPHFA